MGHILHWTGGHLSCSQHPWAQAPTFGGLCKDTGRAQLWPGQPPSRGPPKGRWAGPATYRYWRRRASTSELTLLIWDRWLFSSSRSISSRWAFFMASMAAGKDMASAPRGHALPAGRGGGGELHTMEWHLPLLMLAYSISSRILHDSWPLMNQFSEVGAGWENSP